MTSRKYILRGLWKSKSCFVCIGIASVCIWLLIRSILTPALTIRRVMQGNIGSGVASSAGSQTYHASFISSPPGRSLYNLTARLGQATTLAVSTVDGAYVKLAVNFLHTSLPLLHTHCQHVMFCTDEESVQALLSRGYYCFPYHQAAGGPSSNEGDFGSVGYFTKTHIKTRLVLDLLHLNYTLLMIDLDVLLFKPPFPYFNCDDCDVVVARDRVQFNTGFILVRPTQNSKLLYSETWRLAMQYNKSHDQAYFNTAIDIFKAKNVPLKIQELSPRLFPCGVYYFQNVNRQFGENQCQDCVMVHNNYIGSIAAKEYRFKENMLWVVDEDGYYSSKTQKYLLYSNPLYFGDSTYVKETQALGTALDLAAATGRIVILPKFHCCDCRQQTCAGAAYNCSLLSIIRLNKFEEIYKGKYRESTFLENDLTWTALKTDKTIRTRPIIINAPTMQGV